MPVSRFFLAPAAVGLGALYSDDSEAGAGKAIAKGLDRVWLDHPFYGRETVREYLARHKIPLDDDGKIVAYHARPKGSEYDELRQGTYLEVDPDRARHYAARDRGLDPDSDIELLRLKLKPDDIEPGSFMTTRRPVPAKDHGAATTPMLAAIAGTSLAGLGAADSMIRAPQHGWLADTTMGARGLQRRLEGHPASLLFPEGLVDYAETLAYGDKPTWGQRLGAMMDFF